MAKIRVYELARELKLESKELIAKMKDLGIPTPSHQSTLTAAQIDKIRASLDASKPKVVVKRRRKSLAEGEGEGRLLGHEGAELAEAVALPEEAKDRAAQLAGASHELGLRPESSELEEEAKPSISELRNDKSLSGQTPADLRQADAAKAVASLSLASTPAIQEEGQGEASLPVELELRQQASAESQDQGKELPSDLLREAGSPTADLPLTADMASLEQAASGLPSHGDESSEPTRIKKKAMMVEGAKLAKTVEQNELEAASAKGKVVDAKAPQAPKKKGFVGATIVRRATVEESEATKAREEARQRTSRREDSRGIRVTGIGVSPRMGEDQELAITAKKSPAPLEARSSFVTDEEPLAGEDRWGRDIKGKVKGPAGRWEEEEKAVKTPALPSAKRRINMRDLLNFDDEEVVEDPNLNKKRRTVYTPGATQKKRDLKRRKDLKSTQLTTPRAAYRIVKMEGASITVGELARQLSVKAAELIKKLMAQGVMAMVNQSIDFDTAALIATEYGFECKNVEKTAEEILELQADNELSSEKRPPIITVMGHVDHGKTSILDVIRQANVAQGESGGITQHIGAYQVEKDGFTMTFLDTPGHAAFSAMRARGAQITDIVILVVAADDGVMPQTVEAISHAKSAGVPIIVAVNKIDKANINLDRIYSELSEKGVLSEEWGGETQFVKVSALKKQGIDELLEAIEIQAEMLELIAPRDGKARGAIIEAHLDKGRGPVATVMVTQGALRQGDYVVVGAVTGKVRAMTDDKGRRLEVAYPSTPVQVIGLTAVPNAGDAVYAVQDEKTARQIADLRVKDEKLPTAPSVAASLDELLGRVAAAEIPQVNVIIKADTQGSVEAIASALGKLNSEQVKNVIVHQAVGGINESDINLAQTSSAVILGFNVRAAAGCSDLATRTAVIIKYYSVIYDLVDTVKSLMAGKLPPIETEVIQGHAEVRNAINVPKIGVIAGSSVLDGKITRNSYLRLIRNEIVIFNGKIASLRRFKDDVKEVQNGYECGISIDGYNDIKVGDVIEAYMIEEKAATLSFNDI